MKNPQRLREYVDPEYDDEVGMVMTNLQTMTRSARRLAATLHPNENLPEWVQEKIAKATSMIVAATNYMESQHEQGQIHIKEGVQTQAEKQKLSEMKKSLQAQLRSYR